MKKTILNLLVIMAFAATAAVAGQQVPSTGTSIGSQSFKPSNNVTLFVASAAGTSTNPGGFSTLSFHTSGNREFATNHSEPKIFWRDKPATATVASGVTCTSSTAYAPVFTSGWNSL